MIDFNKLIDTYLARTMSKKSIGRYYPSEIGTCLRKTWYSYTDPKPTETELIKVFEVGNMVHDFIAKVIKSDKNPHVDLLESELPFKIDMKDFVISGRIDDLLLLKENNMKLLVEVKSTKALGMQDKASPQHVMQLQLYMHQLQIHDGVVLYVEKNNLHTKAFDIKYDEKVAAEALNRFAKLHKHLSEKKIPVPEARLKHDMFWMCNYCEWREECYKETPDGGLHNLKAAANGL